MSPVPSNNLPLLKSPRSNMNENNIYCKSFKTYLSDSDSTSHSSCECNDMNSNV